MTGSGSPASVETTVNVDDHQNPKVEQEMQSTEKSLADAFFEKSNASCLSQGDILYTEILNDAISKSGSGDLSLSVYPYFFKTYKLCIVLNATCDLVIGKGRPPKIDCVQLVALSPLISTLEPIIKKHADTGYDFGLIDEKSYVKLADEFRRIVDGQHKNRYFLPQIPNISLQSPWTARLDVIVSIRYNQSNAFLAAQTGHKICSQRASKLAENTAALFNRIALDDVRDVLGGSDRYDQWVKLQVIDFCKPISSAVFAKVIPLLRKACQGLEGEQRDSKILELLEQHRNESLSPQVQKLIEIVRKRASGHLSEAKLSKFMDGLGAQFTQILMQKS